jgi:hypothetical protein
LKSLLFDNGIAANIIEILLNRYDLNVARVKIIISTTLGASTVGNA